jgi:transcriptional antiterminator NusG
VRVIEGPFVNFQGAIDDLNPERGKLKVMVAIFGRLTPVELEYYQVERL